MTRVTAEETAVVETHLPEFLVLETDLGPAMTVRTDHLGLIEHHCPDCHGVEFILTLAALGQDGQPIAMAHPLNRETVNILLAQLGQIALELHEGMVS